MKKIFGLLIALLSCVLIISCNKNDSNVDVISSFYAIDSVVKDLTKDTKITSDCLIKGTSEPHDFEPSIKDVTKLNKSNLILFNGNDFEEFSSTLSDDIKKKVVEVSSNVEYIGKDPHTFVSPKTMIKIVNKIKDTLILNFKNDAEIITKNYESYIKDLTSLDNEYTEFFSNYNNTLVVSHEAYNYFARDYKIDVKSVLGIHEEEPTAKEITQIEEFLKENNITRIYGAYFEENEIVNKIAKDLNIKVKTLYTGEMMDSSNLSYLEITRINLKTFKE